MATTFNDIIVNDTIETTTLNGININTTFLNCSNFISGNIEVDNILNNSNSLTIGRNTLGNLNLIGQNINIGNSLSKVNLLGNVTYLNTQEIQVYDNNILLNYGGSDISAVGGGISVVGLSNISKANIIVDANLDWVVTSTNNKLSVDKLVCSNISGLSSVSSTNANIINLGVTNLTVSGTSILNNSNINGILNVNNVSNLLGGANIQGGNVNIDNTFYVDSVLNRVGIGLNNPSVELEVLGNVKCSGISVTNFSLQNVTAGNLTIDDNTILGNSISDTLTVNATSTFNAPITAGNLTIRDNTTLGNISTDTLTVNATSTFNTNTTIGISSANVLTCNASTQLLGGIRFRNTGVYERIYSATGTTTSGQRTFTTPSGMFTSLPIATVSCIVDDINMRICWIRTATFSAGVATFVCRVVATDNSTVSGVPVNIICIGD